MHYYSRLVRLGETFVLVGKPCAQPHLCVPLKFALQGRQWGPCSWMTPFLLRVVMTSNNIHRNLAPYPCRRGGIRQECEASLPAKRLLGVQEGREAQPQSPIAHAIHTKRSGIDETTYFARGGNNLEKGKLSHHSLYDARSIFSTGWACRKLLIMFGGDQPATQRRERGPESK